MLEFVTLEFSDVESNQLFLADWQSLLARQGHPLALYSSPAWFTSIGNSAATGSIRVVAGRDESGKLTIVVPVRKRQYSLKFDIYSRVLFSKHLEVVELLGGTPVDASPVYKVHYQQLVDHLIKIWPNTAGLYIDVLPQGAPWSNFLHSWNQKKSSDYFLHSIYGIREWYRMKLHDSMEAFMGGLGTKQRYNLKRVSKRIQKMGKVVVHHCHQPEHVNSFLTAAESISRQTWQFEKIGMHISNDEQTRQVYSNLASAGILRSYYMELDGEPIAYVTGHQGQGIYHQHEIGYIQSMTKLAPGMALFLAMLDDLHSSNKPLHIDFGVGFADYKKRYGNELLSDESVLLLQRSFANRALIQSHQGFLRAIEWAKHLKGFITR